MTTNTFAMLRLMLYTNLKRTSASQLMPDRAIDRRKYESYQYGQIFFVGDQSYTVANIPLSTVKTDISDETPIILYIYIIETERFFLMEPIDPKTVKKDTFPK